MATSYTRRRSVGVDSKKPVSGGLTLQQIRKRNQRIKNTISIAILIFVSLFFVLPLVYTISSSVKYEQDIFDGKFLPDPMIKPFWYNFFGRKGTVKDLDYNGAFFAGAVEGKLPPFARYYLNSIFVGVMITFLQLVTCSLAAYAFARIQWPGRDKVFLAYLGTMMVPGTVTMIPVFILFKNIGIIDTYLAVILPGAFSAYGTFMLRQYFISIPRALEEAAIIDGANKLQILRTIIVPLSKTALSTMGIFTFLYAWNDFMWPLIVIHTEELKTIPIGLQSFFTSYGAQWHLIMAASLIALIPIIVVFVVGQKYITRGIMMTGLK